MEKDKDVNWLKTNLLTAKNHSVERGDMLHGSCTVIPQLAAQKLYGIHIDFSQNSSDFVKFLVTCRG